MIAEAWRAIAASGPRCCAVPSGQGQNPASLDAAFGGHTAQSFDQAQARDEQQYLGDLETSFPDQRFYPVIDIFELVCGDVVSDKGNDRLSCP